MSALLDTDIIIQALAGRSPSITTIQQLAPDGLAISLISVGEVYEGALGSPNPAAHLASFRQFLRPYQVLTLNDPIMERFAAIRLELRRRGQLIPDCDLLIAATAIQEDLTLVTYNLRHFERIPGLHLYPHR